MSSVGERIKKLRKERRFTQKQLAEATGVSRSNISKLEANLIKGTSKTIMPISKFFNVTSDWILFGDDTSSADYGFVCEEVDAYEVDKLDCEQSVNELLGRLTLERLRRVLDFLKFELYLQERDRQRIAAEKANQIEEAPQIVEYSNAQEDEDE